MMIPKNQRLRRLRCRCHHCGALYWLDPGDYEITGYYDDDMQIAWECVFCGKRSEEERPNYEHIQGFVIVSLIGAAIIVSGPLAVIGYVLGWW